MHILYEYIGVKGLRVDASKHMWPGDLEAIQVNIVKLIGIEKTTIYLIFCVFVSTRRHIIICLKLYIRKGLARSRL